MPGTSTTTASSLKKIAASFLAPPPLQPPPSSCAQTDTLLAVLSGWFWFDSLTTFWISIYNSQGVRFQFTSSISTQTLFSLQFLNRYGSITAMSESHLFQLFLVLIFVQL
ncbi:unnamed protein product [Camellia sinensis]